MLPVALGLGLINFNLVVFRRHRAQEARFGLQPIFLVMARLAASLLIDEVGATRDVLVAEIFRVASFAYHKLNVLGEKEGEDVACGSGGV
jgi:hypothetical protein